MNTPTFTIILNEFAGSGQATKTWKIIEAELKHRVISYTVIKTKYPKHAITLAERFATNFPENQTTPKEVLLVIGGDGTLHEAVTGLQNVHRGDVPVAYIPSGSGNDFARGIHLSREPITALNQILATTSKRMIDIGVYHEAQKNEQGIFLNNLGIGFDAAVVSATNNSNTKKNLNKYHLGSLSYVVSLVKVFSQQQAFPVTIRENGHTHHFDRGFLVTTTNHPYFGGGIPIMPEANVLSDHLDLVVVEKLNPFFFIYLFIAMFFGKHVNFKAFNHFTGKKIEVRTSALEFGQIDGEEMGSRFFDVTFSLTKQALWIDLPELKESHQK